MMCDMGGNTTSKILDAIDTALMVCTYSLFAASFAFGVFVVLAMLGAFQS
jgi:hypothetical protein